MKRLKRLLVFLIVVLVIENSSSVWAYNFDAPHEVNKYHKNPEEIAKLQKLIWGELRSWGMPSESVAGLMGNMMQESGCDYTRTQSSKPWERGKIKIWGWTQTTDMDNCTGIGLTQWTYGSRQQGLFDMADSMGKQWNSLEVQMSMLKSEIGPGNQDYAFLYSGGDMNNICLQFEKKYERAGKPMMENRYKSAKLLYNAFKDTPPTPLAGMIVDTPNADGTVSSDVNLDSVTVTEEQINKVVEELKLTGMRTPSQLTKMSEVVELATREDLGYGELYNVTLIGENVKLNNTANLINKARTAVVFVGLLGIIYGCILLLGLLFDKVNSFLEISLIGVFTFGGLKYSEEEETKGMQGYASSGKIVCISAVIFTVSCLLISGGVLPVILETCAELLGLYG